VLNLPSSAMVDAVDRLAMFTGTQQIPPHKASKGYQYDKASKGYQYEPDKFGIAGLTAVPADLVGPPCVAECPIQLEAVVDNIYPLGGHDSGLVAFEVSVIRCHIDEAILVDGSDRYIDPERWDPLIMKFCEFYGAGTNLRPSRLAEGWGMHSSSREGSTSRPTTT
jgi:flavin reductase (DIM6/NTAB) family NADH-FMN oxidoreductase RutF